MSTNTIFLEDDYMMEQKLNDRFHIRELSDTSIESLKESFNPMEDVLESNVSSLLDTREPRRSGRIVMVPDRFMFFGEVVSNKHDLDSSSYNEAISNKDSKNWQSAMKVEEFIYMMQPDDFIVKSQEHMVWKLYRSICGLMQAFQS